jgi:transglutaminase-like putative cysteine protease
MEEQECCILGVCCDVTLRIEGLAEKIHDDLHLPAPQAMAVAQWIRDHYDLTPKGLIQPLIDYVAAEAREYPYQKMS